MRLYLLRHGIAEDARLGMSDRDRALTEAGRVKMRLQARALRRGGLPLQKLISSPLVRTVQTAEIIAEAFELEVERERLVSPGCRLPDMQEVIGRYADVGHIMLVGHQPDLGAMVRALTGAYVKMRKGTMADLEIARPGSVDGILRGLYDPDVMAALG